MNVNASMGWLIAFWVFIVLSVLCHSIGMDFLLASKLNSFLNIEEDNPWVYEGAMTCLQCAVICLASYIIFY